MESTNTSNPSLSSPKRQQNKWPPRGSMNLIYDPAVLEHDTGIHPENAHRFRVFSNVPQVEAPDGAPYLPLVHCEGYIRDIKAACEYGQPLDADTPTSPGSFTAARHAVGATILAADTGGFALVRPPGHHAYPNRASGFCLFNNIAVAVQKLVQEGKRVVIFDFDGHLGDGTSEIFYRTDQVLFWSIHQYPAYPGHGFVDEIGVGKGKGFNINTPLPPGSGDDILNETMDYFLPVLQQFQPDVVALSAGFDAHHRDLLLDLRASVNFYYDLGRRLRKGFSHTFATLEGGYSVKDMPKCLYNFLAGMNGLDKPYSEPATNSGMRVWETFEIYVHAVMGNLRHYWKF